MRAGDLLARSTRSRGDKSSFSLMLELSWKGSRKMKLAEMGEVHKFMKNGDTIVVSDGAIRGKGSAGWGLVRGLPSDTSRPPVL